ncbi:MAG: DoxX family membrane protein [Dehalococcoidia bacterium]|nr:DoxX family membrane protein [Dehalococcoidia bacterium]
MANVFREREAAAAIGLSDWLTVACRLAIGALFLLAGGAKLAEPGSFSAALVAYAILPVGMVYWVSLLFPWGEVLLGLLLLSGTFTRAAAWTAIGLLLLFSALIAQALLRGLSLEDCGCFGGITEAVPALSLILGGRSVGWHDVVRDLIYALIALPVAVRERSVLSLDAWRERQAGDAE